MSLPESPLHFYTRMTPLPQFYREKLRADVEGRDYTPPSPAEVGPPVLSGGSMGAKTGSARSLAAHSQHGSPAKRADDDWGDWSASGGASASASGAGSHVSWGLKVFAMYGLHWRIFTGTTLPS